ncbi:hypothetical protein AMTRI_Chr08g166190 [Amborella trichopoda]
MDTASLGASKPLDVVSSKPLNVYSSMPLGDSTPLSAFKTLDPSKPLGNSKPLDVTSSIGASKPMDADVGPFAASSLMSSMIDDSIMSSKFLDGLISKTTYDREAIMGRAMDDHDENLSPHCDLSLGVDKSHQLSVDVVVKVFLRESYSNLSHDDGGNQSIAANEEAHGS